MNKDTYISILTKFLEENDDVKLYLLGSGNLLLQGINVLPNDIDLITDKYSVKKLSEKYKTNLAVNEVGYVETEIPYDGSEVHIVSNDNNPLRPSGLKANSTSINTNDLLIYGLTLESERLAYQKMGRPKDNNKVELINNLLKNK